jgi:hypothetical protein
LDRFVQSEKIIVEYFTLSTTSIDGLGFRIRVRALAREEEERKRENGNNIK